MNQLTKIHNSIYSSLLIKSLQILIIPFEKILVIELILIFSKLNIHLLSKD